METDTNMYFYAFIVYNNEKSTRILQVANMVRNKEKNAVERWVIYKKQRKNGNKIHT